MSCRVFVTRVSSDRGFSLPEVCVAAGLVATAAASLAALFALSADANRTAADLMHATVLARQKLEELRRADATAPSGTGSDVVDRSGGPPDIATAPTALLYHRRWRSEPLAMGGAALVEVEVTSGAGGRRHPVRVRLVGVQRSVP